MVSLNSLTVQTLTRQENEEKILFLYENYTSTSILRYEFMRYCWCRVASNCCKTLISLTFLM